MKNKNFILSLLILLGLSSIILWQCEEKENLHLKKLTSDLKSELEFFIKKQPGLVAVSLSIPHQNIYLGINDTISMHAASTMKVPVMMEVFNRVEQGQFSLDDSLMIKNEFKSIIDGSPYSLDIAEDSGEKLYSFIGKKESIRNLVIDMIINSSNLATNLLIDYVGASNVQQKMEKLGAFDIQVLRGVEDIKAYRAGKSNTTTAKDLTIILQAILEGKAGNSTSTEEMINILLDQNYNTKIPAKLPQNVKVAHKTGSITAISHDTGIIYPENRKPYVLTVLTKGFDKQEPAHKCIAEISKIIYDWYVK
jgi:beta-lactamase class A